MTAEGGFKLLSRESFLLLNNVLLARGDRCRLIRHALSACSSMRSGSARSPSDRRTSIRYFCCRCCRWRCCSALECIRPGEAAEPAALKRRLQPAGADRARWRRRACRGSFSVTRSVLTMIGVSIGLWVIVIRAARAGQATAGARRYDSAADTRRSGACISPISALGFSSSVQPSTSSYNVETDRTASPGDSWNVAGYDFVFRGTRQGRMASNFEAVEGEFEVRRGGELVTVADDRRSESIACRPAR